MGFDRSKGRVQELGHFLMARLAGMTLRERWSSWTREPFTSESDKHVSVWAKTGSPT